MVLKQRRLNKMRMELLSLRLVEKMLKEMIQKKTKGNTTSKKHNTTGCQRRDLFLYLGVFSVVLFIVVTTLMIPVSNVKTAPIRYRKKVNPTTGQQPSMYVHINGSSLKLDELRNVVSAFNFLEPQIDLLVPEKNRGNQNRFCKTTQCSKMEGSDCLAWEKRYRSDSILRAPSISKLIDIVNPALYHRKSKYYKLNIRNLMPGKRGDIEFRNQSPSTGTNINAWMQFCSKFVEKMSKVDAFQLRRGRGNRVDIQLEFDRLVEKYINKNSQAKAEKMAKAPRDVAKSTRDAKRGAPKETTNIHTQPKIIKSRDVKETKYGSEKDTSIIHAHAPSISGHDDTGGAKHVGEDTEHAIAEDIINTRHVMADVKKTKEQVQSFQHAAEETEHVIAEDISDTKNVLADVKKTKEKLLSLKHEIHVV